MERLEEYRRKRDFTRTREPAGEAARAMGSGDLYVMHKHAASHDHFDLRLEQDGVLRSWALPKGPSLEPGEKRLAVEVEDHPLDYGDFEGVIPEKAYGGGTVMLWDRGRWRLKGRSKPDRIDIELDGERLKGSWTLARMSGKRQDKHGRNWLMIKRHDDKTRMNASLSVDEDSSIASGRSMAQIAEDRDATWSSNHGEAQETFSPALLDPSTLDGARRAKLPREMKPQLATLARDVPSQGDWIHEIKLDGYRLLARVERGGVRLTTRNGKDWTERFPHLGKPLKALPVKAALLDGEVVAMGKDGITRFGQLQEALSSGRTAHLVYQAFDLLYLEGYDLTGVALIERKRALAALLETVEMKEGTLRYSDHIETQGAAFHERACQMGLEGIICKRADSRYRQKRSRDWLKVKCVSHEEFVIGGYTAPGGSRSGFGSLLMGAYGKQGLLYAGRVGTGFSNRLLEQLSATLRELEIPRSPFHGSVPDNRSVHWVRPELVIEVEFTERTRDGRLRHPAFRGLREDRNPEEIRMTASKEMAADGEKAADDKPAPRRKAGGSRKSETSLLGVRLTHPDRVLFPEQGLTKLDLARFYEQIQDWVLPRLARRPLSLVRCPQGRNDECFFQKHPRTAIPDSVPRIDVPEKKGSAEYVYVESAADLVGLVQAGALEIHPWGSRIDHLEQPDSLVFDLDPDEGIAWQEILRVAGTLRERIESLGLTPFLRTTGGKGLHLVVPLEPSADWDRAKAFARAIAEQHAKEDPKRLTTNMSKAKREGRIFIDYLRNGRGATAVASYTVRARENAPVAVPIRWDELNAALRADRYNVENLRRRLSALRQDPWADFARAARPLDADLLGSVGVE